MAGNMVHELSSVRDSPLWMSSEPLVNGGSGSFPQFFQSRSMEYRAPRLVGVPTVMDLDEDTQNSQSKSDQDLARYLATSNASSSNSTAGLTRSDTLLSMPSFGLSGSNSWTLTENLFGRDGTLPSWEDVLQNTTSAAQPSTTTDVHRNIQTFEQQPYHQEFSASQLQTEDEPGSEMELAYPPSPISYASASTGQSEVQRMGQSVIWQPHAIHTVPPTLLSSFSFPSFNMAQSNTSGTILPPFHHLIRANSSLPPIPEHPQQSIGGVYTPPLPLIVPNTGHANQATSSTLDYMTSGIRSSRLNDQQEERYVELSELVAPLPSQSRRSSPRKPKPRVIPGALKKRFAPLENEEDTAPAAKRRKPLSGPYSSRSTRIPKSALRSNSSASEDDNEVEENNDDGEEDGPSAQDDEESASSYGGSSLSPEDFEDEEIKEEDDDEEFIPSRTPRGRGRGRGKGRGRGSVSKTSGRSTSGGTSTWNVPRSTPRKGRRGRGRVSGSAADALRIIAAMARSSSTPVPASHGTNLDFASGAIDGPSSSEVSGFLMVDSVLIDPQPISAPSHAGGRHSFYAGHAMERMSMSPEYYITTEDDGALDRVHGRRRNRPIPLPVPIPNLTKKSRGRKVPSAAIPTAPYSDNVPAATSASAASPGVQPSSSFPPADIGDDTALSRMSPFPGGPDDGNESGSVFFFGSPEGEDRAVGTGVSNVDFLSEGNQASTSSTSVFTESGSAGASASASSEPGVKLRSFVCKVPECGKAFVRGEHLKRHVRSIHTYDKPHTCPYQGCGKSFSRRDNLGQHVRIHL